MFSGLQAFPDSKHTEVILYYFEYAETDGITTFRDSFFLIEH